MVSLGVGCRSGARSGGSASASASASAAKAPSLPQNVDGALLSELTQIADSCKVDAAQGVVSCSKGEQRALIAKYATGQQSRAKAVPSFAAALKSGRQEVRAVAAHVLQSAFSSSWGPDAKPGSVLAADADALLAAAVDLTGPLLRQALPAAVHASFLAGRAEALYAALDKKVPAEQRPIAYRYLMTHGRLQAFPKVQELAKDKETPVVLAALESPRNMVGWTDAEYAAICPWGAEFLSDSRPVVVSKAAGVLSSCGGTHVDKLLDMIQASLDAKTLYTAKISAFRDLCLTRQRSEHRGPSEAQCDRARKLLENAVESKALDAQARGMALVALAHQWPDKRTLTLAKRYDKSSEKALAEHAGRVVQRIEQVQRSESAKKDEPGEKTAGRPPTPNASPAAPRPPAAARPAAPAPAPQPTSDSPF